MAPPQITPQPVAPVNERPATIEEVISAIAKQHKVAPALALAVAQRESRDPKTGQLNINAVGDAGKAIGIGQLHAAAAKDTGVTDRTDPVQNVTGRSCRER